MAIKKEPSFETFPTLECTAFTLACVAAREGFYNLSAVVMDKYTFKTTELPFFITFKDHVPWPTTPNEGDPVYGKVMDYRFDNTGDRLLSQVKTAASAMIDKELNKVIGDDMGKRSADRYVTVNIACYGINNISVAEHYLTPVEVGNRAAIEVFAKDNTPRGRHLVQYDLDFCPLNLPRGRDVGIRHGTQPDIANVIPALLNRMAAHQGHRLHREEIGFEVQSLWGKFIVLLEDGEWCVYTKD